jgi:hypothetical protein
MSKQNSKKIVQTNHATKQRNVVGKYHDNSVHNKYSFADSHPFKSLEATLPNAELDALSVSNPEMFRYLFRFDATPDVRRQIIEIKNKYKWNKRQVFWQHISGHLVITEQKVKIMPKQQMLWLGQLLLGVSCFSYALLMLLIIFYTAPSWKLGLGAVATVSFLGMLWILNAIYFAPWYALERSRASCSPTN